ncbi:MAG: MBL fold metallo-hydrolase [Puniceicoccaceae bacterium]|nr:MBL fold metallo-hydrolase [Puniceicoccaceae bacterium]RCL29912.1 MAG: MBL fold metallo-hydrolase [Puniceicoccaceae bacterium]|tara:strand:+ start:3657 stop:4448 length:792 start_codon:yes stop_codon:yes gene_type:complete
MKFLFLGTGTSQGVPMIAQPEGEYACDLSNKKNWRTRCSVHVELGGQHIQIDAGPEFRVQCIENKVRQIDYFILTHAHADHVMGMDDLRRFCDLKGGRALSVFSTKEGLDRVRAIFPYAIADKPAAIGYPAFELQRMPDRLEIPGGWIDSTLLPHGSIQVLGLVFTEKQSGKRLAYYTDCKRLTDEAYRLAEGVDVLVIDGLRPASHPTHMNIEEAVAAAQRIKATQTYLTHMTYFVDYEKVRAELPDTIDLAYDGLSLNLSD